MKPSVCSQEWILLCQELYRATSRWVAEHPDAAPADIAQIITTSCTYLHARLTYDLTRHHDPAQRRPESAAAIGVLIRFAPAVWRCQDTDDLVTIRGIAGYSHDGQVLYLKAAQSQTGIPLHDLVRYADDPTDPSAPLVVAHQQEGVRCAPPARATVPVRDAEPISTTEHTALAALLLPAAAAVRVACQTIHAQTITVALISTQTGGCCPACGTPSQRIHGSYIRTLADCPWAEQQVVLRVRVRRFVCAPHGGARRTFTEDRPGLTVRSARRTLRRTVRLRPIGLALGGQAGARLAQQQHLPTSPDTLLRLVCASVTTPAQAPRVLGSDDWAFKKGHTYGTILVDRETRQPIDLLPDRSADGVAAWLRDHPGVEIACRDRAPAYADGVTRGAPHAIQVADRFHLLLNMREALQRLCTKQQAALQAASVPSPSADAATPVRVADPSSEADVNAAAGAAVADNPTALERACAPSAPADGALSSPDTRPPTKQERQRQACRAGRVARYEAVRTLHAQGLGIRAIARQLAISRHTVKRFLAAETFPEQATRGATTSILDPYKPYLQQQVTAGVQNARQLWEELRAQGFLGSAALVRQYVGTLRVGRLGRGSRRPQPPAASDTTAPPSAAPPPQRRRLSARRAAWLLLCPDTQRTTEQQAQVEQLLQASVHLATAHTLAQDFGTRIRQRQRDTRDDWLKRALERGIADLVSFARGIQQTYAEVAAALELPWSSGQVEGQINRLKTIKRLMYGRAGFALLRAMVLAPG